MRERRPAPVSSAPDIFQGPGPVRARCREVDWATTPPGPAVSWPDAVKVAVQLCLDARNPVAVLIGSDLTMVYNESYAQVLGAAKHPRSIGRPLREVWPDHWEALEADLRPVLERGEAKHYDDAPVVLELDGVVEERYFSYSFTPLREPDGSIVGVFNVFHESTAGVRALLTSERTLAFALSAAGVGTWSLDLETGQALRSRDHDEVFGYSPPRPTWTFADFREHVVPEDGDAVDRAFSQAQEGQDLFFECRIRRADGEVRWIRVGGRFEPASRRERGRMLGIVEDITDRKLVELEGRQEEERRSFLFSMAEEHRTAEAPLEVLEASARLLGEHLEADRCCYVEVHAAEAWAVVEAEHLRGGATSLRGRHDTSMFDGVLRRLRREAPTPIAVNDLRARAGLPGAERSRLLLLGLRSLLVVPLRRGDRILAVLLVTNSQPRQWRAVDRTLARETAERTWAEAERVRAESALRESEARLRSVLDGSLDAMYRLNLQTNRYEFCSPSFEKVVGLSSEWVMARGPADWFGVVHPEDAERVRGSLDVLDTEGRLALEFRVRDPDGRYRWLSNHLALVRDPAGVPLYRDGTIRDVTAQKVADQALRASERRYRTLFESMDQGLCIIEMLFEGDHPVDYRYLEVNPAFHRHTGIDDPIGKTMRDLVPAHDEHWFTILGEVATTQEARRFEASATALGRIYDVYCFPMERSHPNRIVCLFQDVTTRFAAEEQLRESDRRKDEYLAMLGHELRNPLGAIRYAAHLLTRGAATDPGTARVHAVLDRQSVHMTRIIDGLLDVSRIAQGKITVDRRPMELGNVVRWVADAKEGRLVDRDITLSLELPEEPLWVEADESRIAQVLDNLLANAIKFTPSGTIRVAMERDGGEAVLRVVDSGVGIRAETLEHIFEPFHQEAQDMARSDGGLGLGLAFARGIMTLHQGSIEAKSGGRGQGTEVVVRLPAIRATTRSTGAQPTLASLRVLVVEDHGDAALMLRELLEMSGHVVHLVERVAEAIALLEKCPIDIVLCDLGLPGPSGHSLAEYVRADPRFERLPLVALSGYAQPEDRLRSRTAGFDTHLVKPVSLRTLQRTFADLTEPRPGA